MMAMAEKRKTRAELGQEALAIVRKAKREGRTLSDKESKRVDSLMAMIGALPDSTFEDGGFASFGEFLCAVAFGGQERDPRIQALQEMGEGAAGGYVVPRFFAHGLRAVDPAEAVIRPR